MENLLSPHVDSLDAPQLTISPADTSLSSPTPEVDLDIDLEVDAELEDVDGDIDIKDEDENKSDEKKPVKKRKSWGQELPTPKTNLPPRYDDMLHLFQTIN
jgi:transcriptional activator HAC1